MVQLRSHIRRWFGHDAYDELAGGSRDLNSEEARYYEIKATVSTVALKLPYECRRLVRGGPYFCIGHRNSTQNIQIQLNDGTPVTNGTVTPTQVALVFLRDATQLGDWYVWVATQGPRPTLQVGP